MTTAGTATVRAARLADAEAIAEVHVASWREAYAKLLPPEVLAALDPAQRTIRWRTAIADAARAGRVVVGEDGDAVVGFAAAGPDPEGLRAQRLTAIYLRATHHGGGLGQALLDAALAPGAASLWVATKNPRAIAFYARNGFALDGATRISNGMHASRMVRDPR